MKAVYAVSSVSVSATAGLYAELCVVLILKTKLLPTLILIFLSANVIGNFAVFHGQVKRITRFAPVARRFKIGNVQFKILVFNQTSL
jgi:hypothetical protein